MQSVAGDGHSPLGHRAPMITIRLSLSVPALQRRPDADPFQPSETTECNITLMSQSFSAALHWTDIGEVDTQGSLSTEHSSPSTRQLALRILIRVWDSFKLTR